ncbi:MAG: hypothetical protein L3J88_09920 [Gammaproteobacteria bacterium]|nr:hypothetical protein [Gammaproteobacteria bacterium]MCF6363638.1 hypothetical protein [Gammaproteobacteria bacterium]
MQTVPATYPRKTLPLPFIVIRIFYAFPIFPATHRKPFLKDFRIFLINNFKLAIKLIANISKTHQQANPDQKIKQNLKIKTFFGTN